MKKSLFLIALCSLVLTCVSCKKEHQCQCVALEGEDAGLLHVLVVDQGLKCEDITEMAYEVSVATEQGASFQHVDAYKVKCGEYGKL